MSVLPKIDKYLNENDQEKAYSKGYDMGMKGGSHLKNPYDKKSKKEWEAWEEGYFQGKKYKDKEEK